MSEKVRMTDFKRGILIEKFCFKKRKEKENKNRTFPLILRLLDRDVRAKSQQVFGTLHNTGNSLILNKRLHRNRLPEIAYRFSFAS